MPTATVHVRDEERAADRGNATRQAAAWFPELKHFAGPAMDRHAPP